jgi:hypothetical protein
MMNNDNDLLFLCGLKGELFAHAGQISHFYFHGITSLFVLFFTIAENRSNPGRSDDRKSLFSPC